MSESQKTGLIAEHFWFVARNVLNLSALGRIVRRVSPFEEHVMTLFGKFCAWIVLAVCCPATVCAEPFQEAILGGETEKLLRIFEAGRDHRLGKVLAGCCAGVAVRCEIGGQY